jgi:hypothetical protein
MRNTMTTSTPYAPARLAREARVGMRRLRRRASLAETVLRTAVLVAALATLAVGLTGALRGGSEQVASRLDAAAHVASVR